MAAGDLHSRWRVAPIERSAIRDRRRGRPGFVRRPSRKLPTAPPPRCRRAKRAETGEEEPDCGGEGDGREYGPIRPHEVWIA